jgi:hypothetical protein
MIPPSTSSSRIPNPLYKVRGLKANGDEADAYTASLKVPLNLAGSSLLK